MLLSFININLASWLYLGDVKDLIASKNYWNVFLPQGFHIHTNSGCMNAYIH
jgi:hypothetical protein